MKRLFCLAAVAMISTLAACGGADHAETNLAVDEVNAMTNLEELSPAEALKNEVIEPAPIEATAAATEKTGTSVMPKPKPAPAKPAPAAPASPKEPVADPHAGHDMNQM